MNKGNEKARYDTKVEDRWHHLASPPADVLLEKNKSEVVVKGKSAWVEKETGGLNVSSCF